MNQLNKKIKILHIINSLGMGGAENWLRYVLKYINKAKYQIDILVHEKKQGYEEEIKQQYNFNVIHVPFSNNLWKYGKDFCAILKCHGPYDIIHSHLAIAGFHAFWGHKSRVPVRLAHSHTGDKELETATLVKKIGMQVSKYLIQRYATAGIAVSEVSAERFGREWKKDPRWRILYCGIDLIPFKEQNSGGILRQMLNIPPDDLVVGHVGRFTSEKNHLFLLDIFKHVLEKQPNSCLLLIGDGPLRHECMRKAASMGIDRKVVFSGIRDDVEKLMLQVMDIFMLPSLYEGLPLVLLEAQAAGLPCILSEPVTEEADVIKPLMKRLSLNEKAEAWADAAVNGKNLREKISPSEAMSLMEKSRFNIAISSRELTDYYDFLLK
jgi:glycosyltransferase involved in cell wall biosynthesis